MSLTYYTDLLDYIDPSYYIAGFIIWLLTIIAQYKMFEKAGEAGWKAIIPIYNLAILFKIIDLNPWLILLYLLGIVPFIGPLVVLCLSIVVAVKVSKAYGHEGGYALGILFLGPVFYMIIGFGSSTYHGKK